MLRSLKSKLILSHFIVILCAFTLTAAIAIVPVRRAQQQELDSRLTQTAETLARQVDLARMTSDQFPVGDRLASPVLLDLIARNQGRIGGAFVLLVDEDGQIVFDSRPDQPLQGQESQQLRTAIAMLASHIDPLTGDERPVIQLRRIQQAQTAEPVTVGGLRIVIAGTPATRAVADDPLYVAAAAPERELPIVGRVVRPIIIGGGIGLIVSILIAALIARSISNPLSKLTTTAREIDAGNLDLRADPSSDPEVGTLVHAFNGMLDRLAATYAAQRRMLAHIAHELRTPLTSIQGYAGAMRDGLATTPAVRDEALDVILEESERMGTLVDQILRLTRLESGDIAVRRESVNVRDLFETIAREFRQTVDDASITLEIDSPSNLWLQGDPEYLRQVLSNLVSNAVRHTPEGGTIRLIAHQSTAAAVRITVQDTGEGIPESDVEHIFDRFYRGSDTAGQGFGLGLAIVREIIIQHRGAIRVESAEGQGTTFTIDLPASSSD